jgi:hypothetical protein
MQMGERAMSDQPEMVWLDRVPYVTLDAFYQMHAERNEAREAANEQMDKLRAERDEARKAARWLFRAHAENGMWKNNVHELWPWLKEACDV